MMYRVSGLVCFLVFTVILCLGGLLGSFIRPTVKCEWRLSGKVEFEFQYSRTSLLPRSDSSSPREISLSGQRRLKVRWRQRSLSAVHVFSLDKSFRSAPLLEAMRGGQRSTYLTK